MLTSIKQRVMRRFPNFDEKQLGFSGFKKLMARVAQEGNIKLVTAGLVDWATMSDEEALAILKEVKAQGGATKQLLTLEQFKDIANRTISQKVA